GASVRYRSDRKSKWKSGIDASALILTRNESQPMRPAICIQRKAAILTLLFSVIILPVKAALPAAFDIVITNGQIIDGTGSPWYSGDIGIREGRIAAIGN